jgi:hypothetical protein
MIGRVATAVALSLAGFVTTPAQAGPAVSCDYRVTPWSGGFVADLIIANAGPAMNGWTVRMTFPTPTTLLGTWLATIEQPTPYVMAATSLSWNGLIGTGEMGTFGWTATATDAVRPAITVNGVSC